MKVIAKRTLREFWEKYSAAKQPLLSWYKAAQTASWQNSAEIKERFSTASIINASRVVFNIGDNNYRLICIVKFDKQIIFIRFIGTHKEYDKINAAEV
ncbi:MAG: type II toxin-antitoxin system HigB family toxin [Deltaproteobacteria bacterium]|nr:type II toxin-antitoxin system HigB family toxin [Candidatus Tharpella aukensis]